MTAGVILHLPMFVMAKDMDYVLSGMAMDAAMLWGMALIVAGTALTAWGLLPRQIAAEVRVIETIAPPEDAPLTPAHWRMSGLLAVALIIDIMKPASLGFVTPGMRAEYGVDSAMVAWFPFAALVGTVAGSFAWGALADIYGRRATILLSSVLFIGTSICGAMPDFRWNVLMCLLMGTAAGGMLPVAYALLAEIMPTKHRGWCLVLIGGIGSVGGYLAASLLSALLQPEFGWRIMWFLNLPTGLLLIALSPFLPESARFLQLMGRGAEARATLARFGARLAAPGRSDVVLQIDDHPHMPPVDRANLGVTAALTMSALAWSLVNFGLLLWLPGELVSEGRTVGASSAIIAQSTLIAAPTILVSTWLYSRWSTRGSLVVMLVLMTLGLLGFLARSSGMAMLENPVLPLVLVIVGSCGVISILLPYAAESYPLRIRGRATGWVAGCSKLGGVMAQGLAIVGVAPPFGAAALVIVVPSALSFVLVQMFGRETLGKDLRELEADLRA